jgi:flavin-dependent dehydrogenase
MQCSNFPNKHSVQFFLPDGRPSAPFYFSESESGPSAQTWQVDRARFDHMLLNNARDKGAEVHEETRVLDVLFEGHRARGIRARFPDGSERELGCSVVVDATGQSGLLARRLKLREGDPNLMNCAFFTRYRGAARDAGIDEGATLILHTPQEKTWFWYIPLPDDTVSVGVVGPIDRLLRGRTKDPQAVFDEEAQHCQPLLDRTAAAEQLDDVRVLKDFSYSSHQIAGDGWVLVGDAFGFLDPIYSSGVFLALKGGEFAADAVLDGFNEGDLSGKRLGRHGPEFIAGMEAMRKLVYAYYSRDFNFSAFLRAHPDCKEQLVDLLIGNVYRKDISGLLSAMDDFCELPSYKPFAIREQAAGTA